MNLLILFKVAASRELLEEGVKLWEELDSVATPLNGWIEMSEVYVKEREVYGHSLDEAKEFKKTLTVQTHTHTHTVHVHVHTSPIVRDGVNYRKKDYITITITCKNTVCNYYYITITVHCISITITITATM